MKKKKVFFKDSIDFYILYGKYIIYETEIVTFQKIQIRMRVKMLMLYSSEGRRKDKTLKRIPFCINKNSSLKLMEFNTPFLLVNSQKNGIDRIYSIRNLIQFDMVYDQMGHQKN